MAFIGWFITRKNWLSVLIFVPVFAYLGYMAYGYGLECAQNFPHDLIALLFCLLQIVLYILAFFSDIRQKLAGICVPVLAVIVMIVVLGDASRIEMGYTDILPDDPSFSAEAAITVDDDSVASVDFWNPEGGVIFVRTQTYGTATITVTDGGETYRYTIRIYKEDGQARVEITPAGQSGD